MSDTTVLTVERFVRASPVRVFQAWTESALMERWQGPAGVQGATGSVVSSEPYRQLVLSWRNEPAKPEQRVTVAFEALASGTQVHITHEPIASPEARERRLVWWLDRLDRLVDVLDEGPLLDRIEAAFDGVPIPDTEHRTLFQGEAADSFRTADRANDHLGRWQDLPDAHLERANWALAHLDAQGMAYYAAPIMRIGLTRFADWEQDSDIPMIVDSLESQLRISDSDDLRGYMRDRFALFTRAQRVVLAAFVHTMVEHQATRDAWLRVLEAEADGPRDDWFEVLWPMRGRPTAEAVRESVLRAFPGTQLLRSVAEFEAAERAAVDDVQAALWMPGMMLEVLSPSPGPIRRKPESLPFLLSQALRPELRKRRIAAHQAVLAGLNPTQRAAVGCFVSRCLDRSVAREAWQRLVDAEASGPRDDWLDVLYAPPPERHKTGDP